MSRKSKIEPAEKVKIIERVLADEISATEAARLIGVDRSSIRDWRQDRVSCNKPITSHFNANC